jgi:hypothetical protein
MDLAVSEKESEIEKHVKSLLRYSEEWQKNNREVEMSQQEIKGIIDDVMSEVKENIKKR